MTTENHIYRFAENAEKYKILMMTSRILRHVYNFSAIARQHKKQSESRTKYAALAFLLTDRLLIKHLLIALAGVGVSALESKAVDLSLAHSVEDPVLNALVCLLQLGEQILHILTLGGVILRAGGLYNGEVRLSDKVLHILLGGIDKRAYQRQPSV